MSDYIIIIPWVFVGFVCGVPVGLAVVLAFYLWFLRVAVAAG